MIEVDGRETSADGSLLDACRRVGAYVPAFCHDRRLCAGAHCRACLVELDGRVVPACTTHARDGQQVQTSTERLEAYRRDLAELMLAEASPQGRVRETLAALGAVGDRYGKLERPHKSDVSHAYLRLDMQRCITCRLCERACADVQGQFVFATLGRGARTHIDWGQAPFAGTDCVSCGACAAVCPTGAISIWTG